MFSSSNSSKPEALLLLLSSLAMAQSIHIEQIPSPNFAKRPAGIKINSLVIHHTAMKSFDDAAHRLTDPAAQVSSHYLIGKDGRIAQLVQDEDCAWHAGLSSWLGQDRLNNNSIGIELDNTGFEPFSNEIMQSLSQLSSLIVKKYEIPSQRIVGHSEIAPTRKVDPSQYFDWKWLSDQGIGFYPTSSSSDHTIIFKQGDKSSAFEQVQEKLKFIGYNIAVSGVYDASSSPVIQAYKRRYNQDSFQKGTQDAWDSNDNVRLNEIYEHYSGKGNHYDEPIIQ